MCVCVSVYVWVYNRNSYIFHSAADVARVPVSWLCVCVFSCVPLTEAFVFASLHSLTVNITLSMRERW